MSFQAKLPVISFFSLTNIVEKPIIAVNIAKSFCRFGYRTLIIDLDFDTPIIFTTLKSSGKLDFNEILTTNDWMVNSDLEIEDVIPRLLTIQVGNDETPDLIISPCGVSISQIQQWQALSEKERSRIFRRMNKLFRGIKKKQSFDIIVLNLPNSLLHASFPIMNSSFCFVITDHDLVSNSLLRINLDAIIGIHPLLKITGVIIDKFIFEYPEKDQEEITKIEDILLIPVLATLPSIRSEKYITAGTLIDWTPHERPKVQDLFDKLTRAIEKFAETPRVIKRKEKVRLYSVFVVSKSGLPLFTHYFLPQHEVNEVLASAGLSSLITSVSSMIGEIIDRQDKTKLIELQKVKLIIEDWRDFKFILLSSSYEETFRESLKMFARTFMNKYPEEIKKFAELSISPTFEGANELLKKHFTLPGK
jgi:cellulose biosynthesis protein BcsQ